MKNSVKPVKNGQFKCDIYAANARYPIDLGDNLSKEEIDGMFDLMWPKGTKLLLYDETEKGDTRKYLFWYTADGDGGWPAECEFAKNKIEICTQERHPRFSGVDGDHFF